MTTTEVHVTTGEIISEALGTIRREYWNDIRAFAEEIVRDIPDDDEAQSEAAHEYADGSSWTIYTREAMLVPLLSDNGDEWRDAMSPADLDENMMHSTIAYFAMRADIEAQLQALRS